MFYDTDNYLVEWRESRWLVLTSMTWIIPIIYSYYNVCYLLSLVSFTTTFISANYWRKATISFRRDMDIVFSKLAFVIYLCNGFYYVRGYRIFIFYPGLIYLIYNYYFSNLYYYEKKNEWLTHHICFHLMILMEKLIILESYTLNNF